MNCNCVGEMEKKMAEYMKPKAGENTTASCTAVGFALGSSLALTINIPFRVKGRNKGYTSEKGKEVIFVAAYCPFCGVSTKTPESVSTK